MFMNMREQSDTEAIELDLLLEAIQRRCGYDFRQYARSLVRRRLVSRLAASNLTHFAEMIPRVLHDERFLDDVLRALSITVTEMFRDPQVYLALRRDVIPALKALKTVKIWHAGCATGEEVYSLAILLKEEGLYDRARIYATDFNADALHTAQEGIYPPKAIKKGTRNYVASGGQGGLSDYYYAQYGSAKMQEGLKANIRFSHHDLATDGTFGEMNLILCRNVLIYFDRKLKNRACTLFTQSLHPGGFLCLGTKETLDFSDVRGDFEAVAPLEKIYRHKTDAPGKTMTEGHTGLLQGATA